MANSIKQFKNEIWIFQREWAFTSSNSQRNIIKTPSFGPCYVVTLHAKKDDKTFIALAHFDDMTDVSSSVNEIFKRFTDYGIPAASMKGNISGGWVGAESSRKWAKKIIDNFKEKDLVLNKEGMWKKKLSPPEQLTPENVGNHYFPGISFNAKTLTSTELSFANSTKMENTITNKLDTSSGREYVLKEANYSLKADAKIESKKEESKQEPTVFDLDLDALSSVLGK